MKKEIIHWTEFLVDYIILLYIVWSNAHADIFALLFSPHIQKYTFDRMKLNSCILHGRLFKFHYIY